MIAKSLGYLVWPSVGTSVGSLKNCGASGIAQVALEIYDEDGAFGGLSAKRSTPRADEHLKHPVNFQ